MNLKPTHEELIKKVEALEREVVECRRAEQAALAGQDKYRNTFKNAVWGIFQTTAGGRFLNANRSMAKILGYESPDELKSSISDIGNQLYVKPIQRDEMLRKVVKQNVVLAFETQVYRKDKHIIWISISERAVKARNGNLLYIEGFVEDITERKRVEGALKESEEKLLKAHDNLELRVEQRTAELAEMNESLKKENSERETAEKALLESEERYRSLIENLPIGIYRNTPGSKGRFIMANPAIARMFGYETVDDFLQTSVSDLYWDPADRQLFSEKLIAQGHLIAEELQLKKFNNTPMWGAVTVNVVHDEAGEIKYFEGIIEEISDRKKAEEALRESEKRFRSVMEGAPDPIVVYNTKGETTYLNPAFTQIFGWSLDELRNRKIDYVPKECLPETQMMIEKINRDESIHGVETRRFTKSGKVLDISISAAVLHDSHGNPTGQITTLRDISERKQVDKILHKEREKFRILVEESPLGVSLIAKNGHYEYLNPSFVEIFGYTLEDIPTGQIWFKKVFPNHEYRSQIISTWISDQKEFGVGEARSRTYTAVCKDGSEKAIHFRPVTMETGEMLIIYEDISERKKAEEALRESEERNRILLESSPDAITVYDHIGNVTYVNPAFEGIFGWKSNELLGKRMDFVPPHEADRTRKAVERTLKGEKVLLECQRMTKKGKLIDVAANASVLYDSQGNVIGMIVIARDITERKKAEEALKNSRRRLEEIIDFLPDPTWVVNNRGHVVAWNRATEKLTGIRADEIIGKGNYEYSMPFYGERRPILIDLAQNWDDSYKNKYTSLKKSGDDLISEEVFIPLLGESGIFLASSARALYDSDGNPAGAIETVRDITERKKAETALREEQGKVEKAYRLLSKYVAPQLVDTISDGEIDQIWKHNRKKLTLFFSDIKDFTSITDTLEPEDMANVLNEYLTEMNTIINKYKGTLAQVIGDGLFIFFGAPKSSTDRDHAIRCVMMAIDMQRKMEKLNKKWFKRGIDEVLQIRCGINTGMATVGGYGSSERKEYTAMGMQTNIAARLEQTCTPGGILISHTTWALVNDEISCSEHGKFDVKGFNRPIRAYSVDALSDQN